MVTILGYVAYAFICLFNPLQLFSMVRRRNINLGAWPLVSLTLGLALLELSFIWVAAPTYVVIGTALSLAFTAVNLIQVLHQQRGTFLTENIPLLARMLADTAPYNPTVEKVNNFSAMSFDEGSMMAGPPPLVEQDFSACKVCDCLIWSRHTRPIEVKVYDAAFAIAREHQNLPVLENLIHTVRVDYYCKRDRPAYDEVVIYPSVVDGGTTTVEFFKYVQLPGHGKDLVRIQCDEAGRNYD